MTFHMLPPRQQLTEIMSRIYDGVMTTLSGGNLSILDDDGVIWITPSGIDKGDLQPRDIMKVYPDGQIDGLHKPSSELPFHRAIYRQRPDIKSIVHAHAPALVTFSIARQIPNTSIIPQARRVCGQVGYAPYALPGSEQLGKNIATTFSEGYDVVLLENHGVATAGKTLLEAFQRLETLDFCARTQMYAHGLGEISTLTDDQMHLFDHRDNLLSEQTLDTHPSDELEKRDEIVNIVRRACRRQLMISTEGVVSVRLNAQDFLITPTGYDRPSITNEDVVLIRDGRREAGKLPSRSVTLHNAIYRQHPHIECIITAQAPYITAFAIVDKGIDTKTIPESYIMLRDIPKFPYGSQFGNKDSFAKKLSKRTPIVLLQNDCVLTTGNSALQAFDRLEIAEFTARSLIEVKAIGNLIPINNHEVTDLESAFAHLMD